MELRRAERSTLVICFSAIVILAPGCHSERCAAPEVLADPIVVTSEPADAQDSRIEPNAPVSRPAFRAFGAGVSGDPRTAQTDRREATQAGQRGAEPPVLASGGDRPVEEERPPNSSPENSPAAEDATGAATDETGNPNLPSNDDTSPGVGDAQADDPQLPSWRSGPIEGIISPREVQEAALPDDWMEPVDIEADDPAVALIGAWRQTEGSNEPDFAVGGYGQSTLYFTGTRSLVVVRSAGDFTARAVFDFAVGDDGRLRLTAPADAPEQSPIRGALIIPGDGDRDHRVLPPLDTLPCTLNYSVADETLSIRGKTYRRAQKGPR